MSEVTTALPRLVLAIAVAAVLAMAPSASSSSTSQLPLRACTVQGIPARCGTLVVPENRNRVGGRRIGLRVVVIPSRKRPALPDAFTYLAGGPGGAATELTATVLRIWGAVNERRDIVLVDQRGTGGSHRLECPEPRRALETDAQARAYVEACFESLDGDPTQYGTKAAMDDLEDVRVALGYRALDVYGTSYGATAAQVYLERHPKSVRTMILDGGTLLDIPFYSRFAVNGARALDQLARRCAADRGCSRAFPRWRAQLTALIRKWNAQPVRVAPGVKLGGDGLAGVIQEMARAASSAASIPLVVGYAAAGDYRPLSVYVRSSEVTRSIMYWSIWCNEPWVGLDSKGPWRTDFDGYTTAALIGSRTVCAYIPKRVEPTASWTRPRSNTPLLALVGGADPQDPVGNLAGLVKAMPNSRIVVVPGQGHAIGQEGCLGELVARFVERGRAAGLDTRCVRAITAPAFVLR